MRTLAEVLALAINSSASGRPLGVYIETKEPAFHEALGLALEPGLLDALEAAGYGGVPAAPLILQSFDEKVRQQGALHLASVLQMDHGGCKMGHHHAFLPGWTGQQTPCPGFLQCWGQRTSFD